MRGPAASYARAIRTRGGTVEYALKNIDEQLVVSDLALLPVSLNEETRAKNANRLVKCVGLGLPFLASDTEEHRRALSMLRLPDDCLVAAEQDWAARIDEVRRNYAALPADAARCARAPSRCTAWNGSRPIGRNSAPACCGRIAGPIGIVPPAVVEPA